jgi:hypothetical protein
MTYPIPPTIGLYLNLEPPAMVSKNDLVAESYVITEVDIKVSAERHVLALEASLLKYKIVPSPSSILMTADVRDGTKIFLSTPNTTPGPNL